MNVLILTPDAVGSTLLQRLLTVYMQFHQFDRPVINIHELTNGIDRFYSPDFNREILGKKEWGYHQSLKEVIEMLSSVDHYKIGRVAQYHIRQRQDDLESQIPFYRYLDENFYIISCRRKNLFEHALSWSINTITKKLNVYGAREKVETFYSLYKDRIQIQPQQIYSHLERYKDYIKWSDDHFSIAQYFEYEQDVPNIEKFILNLPVFAGQPKKVTWNQTFGIDFETWNRCHYLNSDIGALAMNNQEEMLKLSYNREDNSQPLAMADLLPDNHKKYLSTHQQQYQTAQDCIGDMTKLGILIGPIPIKKQTLSEKMFMVANIQDCINSYNFWARQNPELAQPISLDQLQQQAVIEYQQWDPKQALTTAVKKSDQLSIGM